jgi:NAD(P)-dependent dehydrogenase (short-subunit alcohol dehydrogenase family)
VAQFHDKVVLITGAARGLGRDYASFFARDGARVVIADIDTSAAEKAAADLTARACLALGVHVDITDENSANDAVGSIVGEFGSIDILVNNAGLWGDLRRTSLLETSVDYWRTVIDVNLTGAFIMSRAVAPIMQERGWGRVVHISSQGAWKPGGPYSVSKLALHSLAYGLAAELAPAGITVNSIAVGPTFNEATQKQLSREAFERGLQANLIKRAGTSADMYAAIRYLCSEEASFVTAQVLSPNGGQFPQF